MSKTMGGEDPAKYMHLSSAKPALLGIGKPSTATNSAAATARGEAMGWTNPPHHNMIT
jgi:hypothetical protein